MTKPLIQNSGYCMMANQARVIKFKCYFSI